MPNKRADGEGSIRQRSNGRWEARYTIGRDAGSGKQIQRSVYGDTQAEVRKKLLQVTASIDEGTYLEPVKMTVTQWLDIWVKEYTGNLKPYSLRNYISQIDNHIKPYIGAVKLTALNTDNVQRMYNRLHKEEGLSPKTLRNIHGILHNALEQAVANGYIRVNVSRPCAKKLPKVTRKEMHPLADDDLKRFIQTIKGDEYEYLFLVDIFTGLRQGEILGLQWSCVDFDKGTITVDKQLYQPMKNGDYSFQTLKNGKSRTLSPAPFVMEILRNQRRRQAELRLKVGPLWRETFPDLVFTNAFGGNLCHGTVYSHFKKAVKESGAPAVRFHDMRHSYAIAALRSGDDVKTVQESMGHLTASFTLDQYGHVTEEMKQASAERMQAYIDSLSV